MKKVSFVVEKLLQNNILFDRNQKKFKIRDNVFDKHYTLYDKFKKYNYNIATNDINNIEISDVIIYTDMPKILPKKKDIQKSYLIIMESYLIRPDNFEINNYNFFKKIFTWNDDLVDNKKYFKINCAFTIPRTIPKRSDKDKLCCLIVGNKDSNHEYELYSERKKAIRWFEENHKDDFDLYGAGWNEYIFRGTKLIRALNRIPIAKKIMFKYFGDFYPSYKGKVDNKFDTMQNYKFAICYENIQNVSGYITDKILDPLIAGCVPVYLGADNVTEHIPKECFIDKRDFNSYDDLYDYISTMSNGDYIKYLDSIEIFLNSSQGQKFSNEYYAKTIVSEIYKENI